MLIKISDLLQLKEFSKFIEKNMGLHFPEDKIRDLERGINYASKEFGFSDIESCIEWKEKKY